MNRIGIGILGAGWSGEYHAAAINSNPSLSLVSVYDRDEGKARDFASRHHIPKLQRDEEYVIDDSDVDIVVVATPTPFHFSTVKEIAKRGKGIVLETPISDTFSEASEIISLAEEEGIFLFPVSTLSAAPEIRKIKERLSPSSSFTVDFSLLSPYPRWKRNWTPYSSRLTRNKALLAGSYEVMDAIYYLFEEEKAMAIEPMPWGLEVSFSSGKLLLRDGGSSLTINLGGEEGERIDFSALYSRPLALLPLWYSSVVETLEKGVWDEGALFRSIRSLETISAFPGPLIH